MLALFASYAPAYVNFYTAAMGMYGIQMLLTPAKMVTDHFNKEPVTPMLKFWIRGQSISILGMLTAMYYNPDLKFQVAFCAATSLAVGILYPWNAKFGYLTDKKLDLKYPMHYVPEALMTGLTVVGALCYYSLL